MIAVGANAQLLSILPDLEEGKARLIITLNIENDKQGLFDYSDSNTYNYKSSVASLSASISYFKYVTFTLAATNRLSSFNNKLLHPIIGKANTLV
jgi:hypothetical protein